MAVLGRNVFTSVSSNVNDTSLAVQTGEDDDGQNLWWACGLHGYLNELYSAPQVVITMKPWISCLNSHYGFLADAISRTGPRYWVKYQRTHGRNYHLGKMSLSWVSFIFHTCKQNVCVGGPVLASKPGVNLLTCTQLRLLSCHAASFSGDGCAGFKCII